MFAQSYNPFTTAWQKSVVTNRCSWWTIKVNNIIFTWFGKSHPGESDLGHLYTICIKTFRITEVWNCNFLPSYPEWGLEVIRWQIISNVKNCSKYQIEKILEKHYKASWNPSIGIMSVRVRRQRRHWPRPPLLCLELLILAISFTGKRLPTPQYGWKQTLKHEIFAMQTHISRGGKILYNNTKLMLGSWLGATLKCCL